MERTGALREVWRRGLAMNEVMQGSSQILPWLGPSGQILLQQQAPLHSSVSTSCSTAPVLSCHFQPCGRVHRHSSDSIRLTPVNWNSSKKIESGVQSKILISNQTVSRSPDGCAHLLSDSHATHGKCGTAVEPAQIVREQARSYQNGVHPAVHNYPVHASRIVASVMRQRSGGTNLYNPSLQRVQQQILTFRDDSSLQMMAAWLYVREAQSPNRKCRREAGSQGARRRGNNVGQLEAAPPQTRSGAAKCRKTSKIIEPNRNTSQKVVGEIQSLHQNTDSLKLEPGRVGDIKANLNRSRGANDALEIREQEPVAREEGQSSAISEQGVTQNRQDLLAEELLRKAHWMDGRSTPALTNAGLNLTAQGRLQSRASYGTRDWSEDTEQRNCSTHMHSAGTTSEAITVLKNRLQRGVTTDSYTYVKVLQMCLKQKNFAAAKQVHDCIIASGTGHNPYVASTLLNVYIGCGGLSDARRIFDELEKKSVMTWNMMIAGYAKSGHAEFALELFKIMRQEGARPNEVTYLSILKACASPVALTWGKELHACIRHEGFESDVRVGTALVQMYAKCGCITDARRVFAKLANRNFITWSVMIGAYAASGNIDDARLMFDRMKRRDLIIWNIMIGAYAGSGRGVEAYRLFLEMRQAGFEPDAVTYISILNASASAGALEWVKEVHGHARKSGLDSDLRVANSLVHMYAKSGSIDDARLLFDRLKTLDVITWSSMIGAYAERGRGVEAYQLFCQMRRERVEPNAITYTSILNASASAGAFEWVKKVHEHASKAGFESDVCVGAALVHMYAKSGSLDDARLVFDRMKRRDVVVWNTMIGALAQHGCGHEALEFFRKMNADLVKPNGTTFVAVLSACCHAGLLHDGRRLFSAMRQDYGVEPDIVHYTCMVDLLGRTGHLEEAKIFISDMPVEPDDVTWKALLGACRTYGNVELGELAAAELFKLEPSNATAYVLLSNIYAAAGKWEKVSLVRNMMQDRGARKEPGRSWIEVDNKIHEFVVGDTSHPEATAIYTELSKLNEKLKADGYIPATELVLQNIDEVDKELALCSHSERLAITYGLMRIPRGKPILVYKNLRVCSDCHTATKFISKVTGREIIARDVNRFHYFKDGVCSCGDYW